jgi:hypothetical protein
VSLSRVIRGTFAVYKIVALAVAAVVALGASVPALADSKEAAEFVLKTCLPAVDDLSKVEAMARQGNWFALPRNPVIDRNSIAPGSGWRADKFVVRTWTWIKDGAHDPTCFVALLGDPTIDRDEFFNAISAAVELRQVPDEADPRPGGPQQRLRIETYDVKSDGPNRVQFKMSVLSDGTVSSAMFSRVRSLGR